MSQGPNGPEYDLTLQDKLLKGRPIAPQPKTELIEPLESIIEKINNFKQVQKMMKKGPHYEMMYKNKLFIL